MFFYSKKKKSLKKKKKTCKVCDLPQPIFSLIFETYRTSRFEYTSMIR